MMAAASFTSEDSDTEPNPSVTSHPGHHHLAVGHPSNQMSQQENFWFHEGIKCSSTYSDEQLIFYALYLLAHP